MHLPADTISAATRPSSLIGGLLAGAIICAWLLLHIWAVFWLPVGWQALIVVPILTWLSVGLFIVSHDAMHGTLMPAAPRLNRALGVVAAALYANFSYRDLRGSHMRHHESPGSAGDPDFHVDAPARFWPWYVAFMRRYFGWRELALMSLRVSLYWLLGAPIEAIMVYFALPALLSSAQLFYFGTYRPHRHEDSCFADSHNARSDDYPRWLSLLTCFHFGYHHEHHLSPGTPWWRLPRLATVSARKPAAASFGG